MRRGGVTIFQSRSHTACLVPGSLPGWQLATAILPFLHPPSPSCSLKNLIGLAQGLPLEPPAGEQLASGSEIAAAEILLCWIRASVEEHGGGEKKAETGFSFPVGPPRWATEG